jgi:hypothetical protein
MPNYPRLADIADIPVLLVPLPLVKLPYRHRAAAALPAALRPLMLYMGWDIQLLEQRSENILHMYILDKPAHSYILDRPDNWRQFQVGTLEWRLPAEVPAPRYLAETPVSQLPVRTLAQLSLKDQPAEPVGRASRHRYYIAHSPALLDFHNAGNTDSPRVTSHFSFLVGRPFHDHPGNKTCVYS